MKTNAKAMRVTLNVLLVFVLVTSSTASGLLLSSGLEAEFDDDSVAIVAHRGYWNCNKGGHARNSFAAFKASGEAGFWATEFDVNMTADGQLLVFHDEVINGKRIDHTEYDELKDYRLSNGEPIPTVDEFLEYALSKKTFPVLVYELKTHLTDELQEMAVDKTIEKLKQYGFMDPRRIIFISFNLRQCTLLSKAAPGFRIQYLDNDRTIEELTEAGVNGIDTRYKYLLKNPDYLQSAREQGFSVNTWTVNSMEDMSDILDLGIDMLTTDNPKDARKALRKKGIRERRPLPAYVKSYKRAPKD